MKKPVSNTELRALTKEMVRAAQRAGGPGTEIIIRPKMEKPRRGPDRLATDGLYIQLPEATKKAAVEEALGRVAARYHLTRIERASSANVIRFDYLLRGRKTQSVHIITPLTTKQRQPEAVGTQSPRLAIIIDDIGNDLAPVETLLNLPFPLTLSILPNETYSGEIAEETYRRGDEVLLHLPMQSENPAIRPEASELRVGMGAEEVDERLTEMLGTVPHAVGVNNHEGSRATADPQLMFELMTALRDRHLFFIDSRTTAATVAYEEARHTGVPAASRKVFLDDVETREATLQQMEAAAGDAVRNGSAIAIGHPHPTTIEALEEGLPRLERQGIRLVFVSHLVH